VYSASKSESTIQGTPVPHTTSWKSYMNNTSLTALPLEGSMKSAQKLAPFKREQTSLALSMNYNHTII